MRFNALISNQGFKTQYQGHHQVHLQLTFPAPTDFNIPFLQQILTLPCDRNYTHVRFSIKREERRHPPLSGYLDPHTDVCGYDEAKNTDMQMSLTHHSVSPVAMKQRIPKCRCLQCITPYPLLRFILFNVKARQVSRCVGKLCCDPYCSKSKLVNYATLCRKPLSRT